MDSATAAQYLSQLLVGNAVSQPISVAARLGLPDLLASGARTADDLARATGSHADSLRRLLRALAGIGILVEEAPGRFALGDLGRPLRKDDPSSLHAAALLAGEPWRAAACDLLYSIKTGEPAFERRFGMSMYRYFESHPDEAASFHAVQASHAPAIDTGWLDAEIDFAGAGTVVDVGGGTGALLSRLLLANPRLRGVLLDLPSVIASAMPLGERGRAVAGDFLDAVPGGGDVYVLAFVLHNWDDARAARILSSCARAMAPGARLLLLESVLPETNPPAVAALLDLEMLVFTSGGRERTEPEFRALLESAGFAAPRFVAGQRGVTAVVARRV